MKNIIFLLFTLFYFSLHAENIYYTPSSAKVLTSDELRSVIIDIAYQTINDPTIPKSFFKNIFLSVETELLDKTRSEVMLRFKKIDASRSSVFDKKILYKTALEKIIRAHILATPSISRQLAIDHSDRILKFYSDIEVKQDGLIHVTEYITVYNGNGMQTEIYRQGLDNYYEINNTINHGIFRDFPATYISRFGIKTVVPFAIKRISRNGNEEQYTTQPLSNGVRIYIGSPDMALPIGVQLFIVEYETKYQLIFHENKDELYWNVNGNGWAFTTDSVFCQVTFPGDAVITEQACYTGIQDNTKRNCICKPGNSSIINFYTDSKLQPKEGLTIAASIQKGIIQPPTIYEALVNLAIANWQLSAMVAIFFFVLLLHLYFWNRYGKDPKEGVIYPRFDPPHGLSPADVGFIYNQDFKNELFSAALVDLAIKKAIVINVSELGASLYKSYSYEFTKPDFVDPQLFDVAKNSYKWDLKNLFGLKVSAVYNPRLVDLVTILKDHLFQTLQTDHKKNKIKKGYFVKNQTSLIVGAALLALIFIATFVSFLGDLKALQLIPIFIVFNATCILQYIFKKLLPAYSMEGMKLKDEIEGFKMYLSTAEEKRYDALNAPEKSIATFEKFLPYAIALDCQIQWGNTFENMLTQAIVDGSYQPTYYRGYSSSNFSMSSFTSSLSSGMSSTISSGSTPPSTSSSSGSSGGRSSGGGGSSGGGSSGGGGGGGGGGGW